ncbi:MAG: ribosome recycling factor, partial [Pseudomonadota bacterium]
MADEFKLSDYERRMTGVIDSLKSDFSGLRTGRASAKLLDPIVVDMYGQKMPINQVGTVSVPEARIALSTALTAALSQTCTEIIRA